MGLKINLSSIYLSLKYMLYTKNNELIQDTRILLIKKSNKIPLLNFL